MNFDPKAHPNYLAVWAWLTALALLSVIVSRLPVPAGLAVLVIYGAAFAKAVLVALYFMHLKSERLLVVALVAVPLTLFVILTVTLLPDLVLRVPGT